MSDLRWTSDEVIAALQAGRCGFDGVRSGTEEPSESDAFERVWTDTRTLRSGDLFVALTGDRFDAHDFVTDAVEKGATGVVISRPVGELPAEVRVFMVEDTLLAYGDLGAHRRRAIEVPVVGLTGSSGKTTTKEFLRAAVESVHTVHATPANLNNRIGVPAMLLDTPAEAEVVIVEMGTSEPGEIARLAEITRPDLAILITVGEAHLEELGSLEGVWSEKLDLLRGRREGGASLVGDLPADLPGRAREVDPHAGVAGATEAADPGLRPTHVRIDESGRVSFRWNGEAVRLEQSGMHVAQDAWIALAAAEWLGVPSAEAARGVAGVRGGALRNEERDFGAIHVIVDCYNANPQSTAGALDALAGRSGVRVALLGSMLELGARREDAHREVLLHALDVGIDAVFVTGDFAEAAEGIADARVHRCPDPADAFDAFAEWIGSDAATLLLKGSRGVRLEELLPAFERRFVVNAGPAPSSAGEGS